MALTALSRHCVIMGCFLTLMGLIGIVTEMKTLHKAEKVVTVKNKSTYSDYSYDDQSDEDFLSQPKESFDVIDFIRTRYFQLTLYATIIISSILMTTGIIKRNLACMAPWFVAAFVGVGIGLFHSVHGVQLPKEYQVFVGGVVALAMMFMLFNPFLVAFGEIQQEQSVKRKQQQLYGKL